MAALLKSRVTPAEYLAWDRRAATKSEYINGEIVAMAGASLPHNFIVANIVGELRQQLKGNPWGVVPSDLRVFVPTTGNYVYPDATVVCGEPQLADAHLDILLNPTIIFEVLSDSTEALDRGQKFKGYRSIASLREYIVVAQNELLVECHVRQPNGLWVLKEYSRSDDVVEVESIGCHLPINEVYDRVNLE